MSDNARDAILPILIKIQDDMAGFRKSVENRLDRLEDIARKQRRDTAGLLVMAKSVTGDFAEQVAAIEERVAALEARRS